MVFTRCSNCGEIYENTMKGLENHIYGNNPHAKNCNEITFNKIEAQNHLSGSWFHKVIMSFKKPQIKNIACQELLDYKIKLNAKLISSEGCNSK